MDPKGSLSWRILLFLSLAFELSYGTGGGVMDCPVILQKLGQDTWLPLTNEHQINKSVNKSVRILVTMATSPGSKSNKKIVSFDLSKGSYPDHLEDGYHFQSKNLSLKILGNRRESEGWYLVSVEENVSVQQFCKQLKLYEQVSPPEIKVLNKTQENENGTCSLLLACTVKKGDHVTYSWSDEAGTHLLSRANRSHLLHITLSNQHQDSIYNCTASNPVSSISRTFNLSSQACKQESSSESSPWMQYTLVPLGVVIIFILVFTAIIMMKRQGKSNHCQPPVEEKSLTIYAQVQKSGPQEKKLHDALTDQDPCTTIYVAATEPAPESVQEPNPTTVYASVTLPES
ncbi:signaling lymphocytic activation molecule isoform 1 precursor [Mus musculus]|uniref:Signaling lymphocytic activation molecule n=3 Tax=Mus musculus TaxID=10090 RepID=SLAF1_MOUSE|nr:signaling lymphocytic activation molecule isoform 1 precursor [Mus musculus]Q9QUM4.1 RecName: Full=Signaling lymphocytic activation molecule; AltName: Full=SLAM family member 1; AltName: CD_antigen=CD150; Flags: Precursor [Mus musculus]AAF13818.1 signaling lymphocytic activation molecule [Mus musculus]AAF14535.1 signaling lymphocytic activation molecule [Mus musculus]AAF22231.1 type I membrane receptor SLAM1 [Mus musculus]AAI17096.1 Signaling lymphocytic activation molecule family member 1 |eukprot:NP_038758.2 signaling lymphocytic activation molecule isoform 1 precursor [Mus musculus]